ncbi:LysR family transcriptional regulator [Thalassotalea psychrophila]|uniref:LysR family transcriptional regulator n=1 Tax=Thalassotalea psychrophila TaxID=3065647 RepID=A0ABY9TS06_9GAMM|nr:LysR family transcriptional regulator [Colwelliaceae bacterium SQ149]
METDISLKQIRVLTCLYREKSLKQCARIIGKTPSAISKILSRLRELYDDPLFITSVSGIEPTPRLLAMINDLIAIQTTLENSLINSKEFDANGYTEEIILSCSMGLMERFGSEIFTKLSALAPNAHIQLYTWTGETQQQLESSQITAAIHILNEEKPKHIYQKTILKDEMVLAVKADHPAQNLTEALSYSAIILKTSGWNDSRYHFLEKLKANGIEVSHAATVDQLSLGLSLIKESDMGMFIPKVAIIPELKYFTFEGSCYMPLNFAFCIKSANRNSPVHLWLHKVCTSILKLTNI